MDTQFKTSRYLVTSDAIDDDNNRILYATRTGNYIKVSENLLHKIENGHYDQIEKKYLLPLFRLEVIVDKEEDEFLEILSRNKVDLTQGKVLSITIQPSGNCQLGCGYCGQVHSKKTMNDIITQKIIDKVKEKLTGSNYETLAIGWYGGEPLMAFNKIVEISRELIKFCNEHNIGYYSDIITNGLSLKPNIYKTLIKDCKISHYQITLDGLAESHDQRRHTKKGEETFDIIFNNVLKAVNTSEHKDYNGSITARINIDKSNEQYVVPLIDLLAANNLQNEGVTIDFCPIVNWGDNNAEANSLSTDEFASKEIDWTLYAIKSGFKYRTVIPSRSTAPCMVVNEDAEVYDANGNIYPCYEFPYTPKYETDEYKIGNLLFPEETYNPNAVTRNWNNDITKNISHCPNCKLFPVCGGGCPKRWYNKEIGCPSFKLNIRDRLVLEYILKEAQNSDVEIQTIL